MSIGAEYVIDELAACMSMAVAGHAQEHDVQMAAQLLLDARVGALAGDVVTMAQALAVEGYRRGATISGADRAQGMQYIEDFALSIRGTLALVDEA